MFMKIMMDMRILTLLLVIMLTMEVILFILFKFRKFWGRSGAGDDFLEVALVEYIDKRSIFGFETTIN